MHVWVILIVIYISATHVSKLNYHAISGYFFLLLFGSNYYEYDYDCQILLILQVHLVKVIVCRFINFMSTILSTFLSCIWFWCFFSASLHIQNRRTVYTCTKSSFEMQEVCNSLLSKANTEKVWSYCLCY